MNIRVFSFQKIIDYVPTKPTYAIRLLDEFAAKLIPSSEHYRCVRRYEFDAPEDRTDKALTPELADTILRDFQMGSAGCEVLAVNCMFGQGRSPAVAIAFNDIFGIGENTQRLMDRFPEYSRGVAKLLKERANVLQIT